jgi:ribosome-associated protein
VHRAESKKASNIRVLDLREVTSFTDYFVICSVGNSRQGQAVCDEIETGLRQMGERPVSIEGYDPAEWVLMDYGDLVVHIFSEPARSYYDLERLWRHARVLSQESSPGEVAAQNGGAHPRG